MYNYQGKLCLLKKKMLHNLEVENYVLFSGLPVSCSLGYSLSDSSEKLFQGGRGGAGIRRSFCWEKRKK